ncbi:TonB-dependent receptor [Microbulbifer bruguierae]|uniref:TonB-dependent receptor n=1 Tax=Microbulbifer bruguierae TaxID=3029061 RepID=A0ABY8NJD1_9GAMM|nr:TonB-dependent receptor [Microbulbifer bruguierae]WGL18444.1 TonB-dependent receptor [Microbulbifer bruguierae]
MNKMTGFKKNSIAVAIATLAGVSGAAFAQSELDAALEEVVVLGIRGSLEKSMDAKRDAKGIVDAISAEDIGKFPDTNLAESMQRITGVSIDRVNGEGSKVTVRGLGPDFNLVTLNGRQLARTTGGRSFDFQNIASDMVTGVEVAKTSDATLPSGGMGATINMLTARPFNTPERTARFAVKGVLDESSDDASITPEYSGFYSDTFADGKFGVAISGSVSERESGSSQAVVPGGWISSEGQMDNNWDGVNDAWGAVPLVNQVNRPGEGDIYSVSQNTGYKFEEQQRERANGQLVLQWAPTDDITATVDYNYYKNKIAKQFNDISVYHSWQNDQRGVWSDGPIASPIIYTELYPSYTDDTKAPSDVAMGGGSTREVYEGDMFAVNLEWQVSDSLNLFFDGQHSEAERRPDSPWGTSNVLSLAALVRDGSSVDYTGEIPAVYVYTKDGIKAADIEVTGSVFTNSKDHSEIDQFRFGGNFELNESSDIDFGIARQEVSNRSQSTFVQRNSWGGEAGTPADLDDSLFVAKSISDRFNESWGDFSEIGGLEPLDIYYAWDFEAVRAAAESLYGDSAVDLGYANRLGDCGTAFCASTDYASDTDRGTTEISNSAYAQYNFSSEMFRMPYQVHAGLRYEETEVDSVSVVPSYTGAEWKSNNEVVVTGDGTQEYLRETGEYDYWLPSISFKLNLIDDIVARAAVSKAITRPSYEDIKGGTTIGTVANGGIGGGSSGNPGLLPFESINYDLSVEWYYGEASYASMGLFRKKVSNFISGGITNKTVFNIPNPADGALVDEARANGANSAGAIREYIATNYADSPFVEVTLDDEGNFDQIFIYGNPATDNDMVFRISQPVNGDVENTIDGVELAVQHMFGESGFGMQANYTYVDSELEYDPFILADQEAMVGLSDSANLVGFYDKHGFQARVAYNWRDDFLMSRGQETGPNPQYTEAYSQIDLNVSYEVPQLEGLQVFLEGINVTDEHKRDHGRAKGQLMGLYQGGPRWQLGARYAF